MEEFKKYNEFLKESMKEEFYKIVLSDINIYVDVVISALKKDFGISCWFLYNNENSFSLKYFQSSDDSYANILKVKKFLHDNLPYFKDMYWYDDDQRLVLRFVEPGAPVKFKFHYKQA
jgi:hypothetical protein